LEIEILEHKYRSKNLNSDRRNSDDFEGIRRFIHQEQLPYRYIPDPDGAKFNILYLKFNILHF